MICPYCDSDPCWKAGCPGPAPELPARKLRADSGPDNPYKAERRARKVYKIVRKLDRIAQSYGHERCDAESAEKFQDEHWLEAAARAEVPDPSAQTVEECLRVMRERERGGATEVTC